MGSFAMLLLRRSMSFEMGAARLVTLRNSADPLYFEWLMRYITLFGVMVSDMLSIAGALELL